MCTNPKYYTGLEPWQILGVDKDCTDEELEEGYDVIKNSLNVQFQEESVECREKLEVVDCAYKILKYAKSYYILTDWDAAVDITTEPPKTIVEKRALEKALLLANLIATRQLKLKRKADSANDNASKSARYGDGEPCTSSDARRRYEEEDNRALQNTPEEESISAVAARNKSATERIMGSLLKKLAIETKKLIEEKKKLTEQLVAVEQEKKDALLENKVLRILLQIENVQSSSESRENKEAARAPVRERVVTGGKVFPCAICERIYQQQPYRSRHMKCHTAEEIRRSKEAVRVSVPEAVPEAEPEAEPEAVPEPESEDDNTNE